MVELKDLTKGTVALSRDGRIAIVTKIKPNNTKYPVIYSFKAGSNGYKGNENDFTAILGHVDIDKFVSGSPVSKPVTGFDEDYMVPAQLKGIKIGDTIEIRNGRKTQEAIYEGYNPRRPKNCVSININGKQFKGPLGIVVGKVGVSKPKRTESEVMSDILNVYCCLSPENLTCDGELPRREVGRKMARLKLELQDLFKELGRRVEEEEAYRYAENA